MFRLAYGKDPTPEYLELVKEVNAQTGAALQPGRWLINYWPFCMLPFLTLEFD